MNKLELTHKQYLAIAVPFILSTVTQPILGAVGIAIVGKLSDPTYIAGVSVGTVIFDTMYWLFGFLRVGTTAFSAQAKSKDEQAAAFFRPLVIALLVGLCFLIFRRFIFLGAMHILAPEPQVQTHIWRYFSLLVFGAPFVLCNYVILGWLMGRALIKASLFMQISGNVLNIILDVICVNYLHIGVVGVAAATLISQIFSTLIGTFFMLRNAKFSGIEKQKLFCFSDMTAILRINSDLMLRTLCLLIQTNIFTAVSASFGTSVLSANAILLQIQSVISYMFDGLANASSVCAGRALAEKNEPLMRLTWRRTAQWCAALAMINTIIFWGTKQHLLYLFSDLSSLVKIAQQHSFWLTLYPLLAGGGLTFYGIFTGSSATKPVRNTTFYSLLVFIALRYLTVPFLQNQGIWLSLCAFNFCRTIFLLPQLNKSLYEIRKEPNK